MIDLIFPPGFHPGQPSLSLAQLKGWLKIFSVSSRILDWNLECYEWFLDSQRCQNALKNAIQMLVESEDGERFLPLEKKKFLHYALCFGQEHLNFLPEAKKIFRNDLFYQKKLWQKAKTCFDFFFRLHCLKFSSTAFSFEVYLPATGVEDTQKILDSFCAETNLMEPFLKNQISNLEDYGQLIGINATTRGQFHSALSLAFLLKQSGFSNLIGIGGSYITRLWPLRENLKPLLDFVDFFSFFSGEENLLEIVQNHNQIPNHHPFLLSANSLTGENYKRKMRPFFCIPDFDDLIEKKWFSPEIVLPIQMRRGCLYGKCKFCEHPGFMDIEKKHQKIGVFNSVEIMKQLHQRYGIHRFYFVDEMLTPRDLDLICKEIKNHSFAFIAYSYFLSGFSDPKRVNNWKESGLKKLWLGMENTEEPILLSMGKKRCAGLMEKILKNFCDCDFPVHLFFLLGYPPETEETMKRNLEWILKKENILAHRGFSLDLFRFNLYRNSKAWEILLPELEILKKGNLILDGSQWIRRDGFCSKQVDEFIQTAWKQIQSQYPENNDFLFMRTVQDSDHLLYLTAP